MSSNKTAKGKNVMTNNQLGVPPNTGFLPLDHAHRAHAVLSASAAKRWLNCPPSARLNEQFPNTSSEYADEGTAAHELCEYKVRKYLHDRMERPQSEYYTEEIEQATDIYAEFVIGIDSKEKHCASLEKDYAIREKLIVFLQTADKKMIRFVLPRYVKALALSITVHDTEHFTVHWFDGTDTEITL